MADAKFEDGHAGALALMAQSAEDLAVIASLVQDGVMTAADLHWDPKARKLALLINRFRWEDREDAARQNRAFERVRALLILSDVTKIASQGITKGDATSVLSLLDLAWEAGEDGAGVLVATFAGASALAVSMECLNIDLRDVTRPYRAPSGKAPSHPEG